MMYARPKSGRTSSDDDYRPPRPKNIVVEPQLNRYKMDMEEKLSQALEAMDNRVNQLEQTWKMEARELLSKVASNNASIETFIAKQGDYAERLNRFADDFRMELATKQHRGTTPALISGDHAPMFAEEELPAEYLWRLERLEKATGNHRYLDINKNAQSVNDRLAALELLANLPSEIRADAMSGNETFQTRPGTSSLRAFSNRDHRIDHDRNSLSMAGAGSYWNGGGGDRVL